MRFLSSNTLPKYVCFVFKINERKLVDMHQHANTLTQIPGPTSAPLHIEIKKNTKTTTEICKKYTHQEETMKNISNSYKNRFHLRYIFYY